MNFELPTRMVPFLLNCFFVATLIKSVPPMTTVLCPVVQGFLTCILPLFPEGEESMVLRRAAVDCFGQAAPADVEAARARHVLEYAAKTCLPRAFAMFDLPYGAEVLGALPDLKPDTLDVYVNAVNLLFGHCWGNADKGVTLMRDSLRRPLGALQDALALAAAGQISPVCATLEPLIERLSGTEELVPMLDALLRITPEHPKGRPALPSAAVDGLSFGAGGAFSVQA